MNPDLRILIALQDLDHKIAALQKQIAEIPNKIQSLKDELQRLQQGEQQRLTHQQDLTKHRRTHEGEVELMRSKLSKLKDQLMTVKTNKEYTAMLHEIQMAEAQIRTVEDKILEIMEEMETLESAMKKSQKDLSGRSAELEQGIRQFEESAPVLAAEVARLQAEKSLMEERVAAELLSHYRRIAAARKGIALAEARDELCSACHVRIRPQVYADLRRSETIFHCDSCDRILFVREAP